MRKLLPRFLAVARIARPWGVRGEMKLEILTDFPEQLKRLQRVYIGEEAIPYEGVHFRYHKGMILMQLPGCETREAAEALRGRLVLIERAEALPLPPGEFYEHEILDMEVYTTEGVYLGRVKEILYTGANDVYVVLGPSGEVLIPAIRDVVRQIDVEANRMVVWPMPGLLDEAEKA
ncbi:MAG: 16S rRNA processing protein RimM [Thermoflexus sp.]|jgi:16S rRNA processing protein RimM|nr:16S rRNA processing protein RimM [Thermoflexus sp.]